ncbi:hypothetical protein KJ762_15910 [bacterium]|nr:hypothetical protein [bacterium]MBU1874921.1 hypothetical protein [bacterium]
MATQFPSAKPETCNILWNHKKWLTLQEQGSEREKELYPQLKLIKLLR